MTFLEDNQDKAKRLIWLNYVTNQDPRAASLSELKCRML